MNPADGAVIDRVPLLVRARAAELGARVVPQPGWTSTLSLWRMALASELVFVGDEGVTEPRGPSRRHGVEWANDRALPGGWRVNAALALSQARFRTPDAAQGGTRVPNAIPRVASAGAH